MKKKLTNKFEKTSIYKESFVSVCFCFGKYEVITLFSKDPIMFGREQIIKYMTCVPYYSVKKITVPSCNYIRYQNEPIMNTSKKSTVFKRKLLNSYCTLFPLNMKEPEALDSVFSFFSCD